MSIFQIKEWWATSVGNNEEFDTNSIDIAQLDQSPDQKIIIGKRIINSTGSFEGFLRIYAPSKREYSQQDLILEENLRIPILQVKVGKYSTKADICIATLHSRKI